MKYSTVYRGGSDCEHLTASVNPTRCYPFYVKKDIIYSEAAIKEEFRLLSESVFPSVSGCEDGLSSTSKMTVAKKHAGM